MERYGDVLVFNPATEFQVIEEFEFDELIERPEEVRFFTLTEQTSNFMDKLLSRSGKITKAVILKAEHEVDSFKKLYNSILKETPTGFEETVYSPPKTLPWVTYSNKNPVQKTVFNWNQDWAPLYADNRGLQANYYIQMVDSLPKSALFYADGEQVEYPAIINGIKTLGAYNYSKTSYREDGTFFIKDVPRVGTQDVGTFTGYVIEVPNPAPPSPLEDHPFLGARDKPLVLDSTEDLPTILPSMEAIFEHAVPRTSNPYKDAPPYLKLYDIKLSQIPWKIWRESFPPVELVEEGVPPVEIPLKVDEGAAPAKVLTEVYKSTWYPGLSTRKWLSTQLDGGTLVAKILLSQAGNLGPIALPPPSMLPDSVPIEGGPEDCLPSVITDFNDFANRGIYRSPRCAVCNWYGHGASDCPDRRGPVKQEYKPGGGCIPLGLVTTERAEEIYNGKSAWNPGTDASILSEYQALISKYTERYVEIIPTVPEAGPALPPSETRDIIVAILEDDDRLPEDKAYDIAIIIDDTEHMYSNSIYREKETNQFLICDHTINQLRGEFERDPDEYLRKWTVIDSGFRVCQHCGERITDVLQAQDEFDENGRLIQMRSKIQKNAFLPGEHITFSASLKKLQSLFNLKEPAEDIFYLLISLLQILPEEEQLKPILDYVKSESAKVNAKIAGKKLTSKQQSDINLALAVFGFNGVVTLLQTHMPQLLPRRSFGGKPMILRGFPRDTDDVSDTPLIDSLLSALQQTFESFPSTFRGTSVVLLRNILNDKKAVKKVLLSSLSKQFMPVFKNQFRKAKDLLVSVDVSYTVQNSFQPPIVRPLKDVTYLSPLSSVSDNAQTRYRCKDISVPWLSASTGFSFRQPELVINIPLKHSSKAKSVEKPTDLPTDFKPSADEIRERIKRKAVEFKPLKTLMTHDEPEFLRSVLLEWMIIITQSKTSSSEIKQYVREKRPLVERAYMDPSTLRDYFKGILNEFIGIIVGDATLTNIIEKSFAENMTVRSLFTKAEEAKKNVDTLRAREREEFKERMRRLPDAQREITKMLIDKGIAPYLITREDREMFASELQEEMKQVDVFVQPIPEAELAEEGVTREDANETRDVGPQGEVPMTGNVELEYDYGDYGDARARNAEGEEFNENVAFGDEEF
jgi:hypothetical protein